ncbi:MAG: hypothetical protein FJ100_12515 [Deltaproteobacteria bacterium]|nr:hypothetical protein [Deltaproteobacteria bacterium]
MHTRLSVRVGWTALLCASFALSCAVEQAPAAVAGFGQLRLALSGALPNVKALRIRIFRGAVSTVSQTPTFDFGCQAYAGVSANEPVVKDLEAADNYAVLIDGFADAACASHAVRAYRGNIRVVAGLSETAAAAAPYWLPTVEIGKFTALAQVNPGLQDKAGQKVCSTESDCKAIHANATCGAANRCRVDHLFPLNGAARRGLPTAIALEDGRVALIGGLGVQDKDGYWKAAAEQVELFDPRAGIFQSRLVGNAGAAVGLAQAVTVTGGAFAYAGGSASVKLALAAGKLTAQLDTRECSGASSTNCAVTDQLGRWTVTESATGSSAQQFALGLPLAFPLIARVATPAGDRLLVAGGSELPLSPQFDKRRGKTQLCKVDAGNVDCPQQVGATMVAGRAMAAATCVQRDTAGGCLKLLLIGGRKSAGSALSETYDAAANKFTAANDVGAVPKDLHGGAFYALTDKSWLLVGATAKKIFMEDGEVGSGGDLAPLVIQVDPGDASKPATVLWSAVDLGTFGGTDLGRRLMPAAAQLADRSVLVIGGLDPELKVAGDALLIGPDGKAKARLVQQFPRFGAAAARVGGKGPFGGCVVLAGGFAVNAAAVLEPQNQVELFCPQL